MEQDRVLAETEAERLDLCQFLRAVGDDEWRQPSLCPGWTTHDVLAHLTTSTRTSVFDFALGMVKTRGSFDRLELEQAKRLAQTHPPGVLIDRLQETAGSSRRVPGSRPLDPLTDALVHGQDIARPLGRTRPMPIGRAALALQHVLDSPFYGAKKRFRDVRLVASDVDWSSGEGSRDLRGPLGDLLLVATGRAAGLQQLAGEGVATVAERLAPID